MSSPKPADTAGFLLRTFGKICFVIAAFIAGYLAWMLWGTSLVTAQAQRELVVEFDLKLEHPTPPPTDAVHIKGSAIARIVIPRIDLDMIVVDGTRTEDLIRGPGLFEHSRFPWQPSGRVAIAGHRTTYEAPFWDLNRMRAGDTITLETEHGTFDYQVTEQRIVQPTDVQIAAPDASIRPTLILTTCEPRFSAEKRLVVLADRVDDV